MDGYRPAGDQTIATGCKGTNGKRCNFLQFIDYIAQPNKIGKKSYPVINEANVPSTFDRENPCPSCAAEVIDWKGQEDPRHIAKPDMFKEKYLPGYGGTYDQRALLGSRYTGGMKHGDVSCQVVVHTELIISSGPRKDRSRCSRRTICCW